MSTGNVSRTQVFRTTKVRHSLKGDSSWIHKPKDTEEEEEKPRADPPVETKPLAVRQNSYVLSTAKKFGSVTSPVSPPCEKPHFLPAEGESDNHANGEDAPAKDDTQPKDATVKAAEDIKPEAATEELIQNGVEEPAPATSGNSEGVELNEQPAADATSKPEGECVDAPVEQSEGEPKEGAAEVSADTCEGDDVGESSAEAVTEQSQDTAEVPAELTVELKEESNEKPKEEPSAVPELEKISNLEDVAVESTIQPTEGDGEVPPPESDEKPEVEPSAEPANTSNLEDAAVDSTIQPVEETTVEAAPEPAVEEAVTPAVEAAVESSAESAAVTNAESTPPDAAVVPPVPELFADSVSEPPIEPAAEPAVKSEEPNAESAAQEEPALQIEAEGAVETEAQPVVEAAVEQSGEPTLETAAEPTVGSNAEAAAEPAGADGEATQDQVVESTIQPAEATNVEASPPEADPEPVVEQSNSEELKLNQESATTSSSEMLHNPVEDVQTTQTLLKTRDGHAVCSFCDEVIGNIKISLSYPPVQSHPDCLKCGVCRRALGDLLTAMFLHGQVIHCESCFAKAL
ncbi:zinc finger protein 185 [Myripristis murdjan]|uniref:zinc finger protein 185 n=1 Tax=Myripristis murdjan TaxID=586833 RepID=UPI001175DCBF|nr:zinc finger protein 185-like [Myripristis murdjan]XP_029924452.1 zinc finger protein 185-like [Myripristis murdjan]